MTKEHRGPYKTNPKYLLKKSDDPTRQVIICIHELQDELPEWKEMEVYVKGHTYNATTGMSDYWNELVGGRRTIFARIEDIKNLRDMVWRKAHNRKLRVFGGGAYSSTSLMQEVEQILQKTPAYQFDPFSDINANIGPPPYIYIVFEHWCLN